MMVEERCERQGVLGDVILGQLHRRDVGLAFGGRAHCSQKLVQRLSQQYSRSSKRYRHKTLASPIHPLLLHYKTSLMSWKGLGLSKMPAICIILGQVIGLLLHNFFPLGFRG